jgi:hypothetical protein
MISPESEAFALALASVANKIGKKRGSNFTPPKKKRKKKK